jgi:hypothetical protein
MVCMVSSHVETSGYVEITKHIEDQSHVQFRTVFPLANGS